MINFDAVDFSERRPEEVISFFWRSVYVYMWVDYDVHVSYFILRVDKNCNQRLHLWVENPIISSSPYAYFIIRPQMLF